MRAVKVCVSQLRAGGQISVIHVAQSWWWEHAAQRNLSTHHKITMIGNKSAGSHWIRWRVSGEWLE